MSDSGLPVDTYISRFQEDIRKRLEKIRKVIKESAPDSVETMSYGIPTYKQGKNLVHFAGYKKHIGFYPTPSGIEAFREELSSFEVSKGTVKFPHGKPVPYDLIRKIVEYRVNEITSEK
jgi:uncharacterized protein YdhG (YjbR/CyaY superfamily)